MPTLGELDRIIEQIVVREPSCRLNGKYYFMSTILPKICTLGYETAHPNRHDSCDAQKAMLVHLREGEAWCTPFYSKGYQDDSPLKNVRKVGLVQNFSAYLQLRCVEVRLDRKHKLYMDDDYVEREMGGVLTLIFESKLLFYQKGARRVAFE